MITGPPAAMSEAPLLQHVSEPGAPCAVRGHALLVCQHSCKLVLAAQQLQKAGEYDHAATRWHVRKVMALACMWARRTVCRARTCAIL